MICLSKFPERSPYRSLHFGAGEFHVNLQEVVFFLTCILHVAVIVFVIVESFGCHSKNRDMGI